MKFSTCFPCKLLEFKSFKLPLVQQHQTVVHKAVPVDFSVHKISIMNVPAFDFSASKPPARFPLALARPIAPGNEQHFRVFAQQIEPSSISRLTPPPASPLHIRNFEWTSVIKLRTRKAKKENYFRTKYVYNECFKSEGRRAGRIDLSSSLFSFV
jgi:hypothetical protein